jgi:hypothetical protein
MSTGCEQKGHSLTSWAQAWHMRWPQPSAQSRGESMHMLHSDVSSDSLSFRRSAASRAACSPVRFLFNDCSNAEKRSCMADDKSILYTFVHPLRFFELLEHPAHLKDVMNVMVAQLSLSFYILDRKDFPTVRRRLVIEFQ